MELDVQKQSWLQRDQPLWLPPGSVRALLVLGLTAAIIGIMLKFAILKEDIPAGVLQVMQSLLPAIVLLIKDYISMRTNGQSHNGTPPQT
jgi:hypothetical protein